MRQRLAAGEQCYVSGQGKVHGVAMESCEGTADFAEALIADTGWSVHLAHPAYVSRMRQNPDKTDYSNTRLPEELERVGYVPRLADRLRSRGKPGSLIAAAVANRWMR